VGPVRIPPRAHAAATSESATIFPAAPFCRVALAASTASGVMPNHFSASADRTSLRKFENTISGVSCPLPSPPAPPDS